MYRDNWEFKTCTHIPLITQGQSQDHVTSALLWYLKKKNKIKT